MTAKTPLEKRLKSLRAFLDMVEGGDGLIGEDQKSRQLKERLRADIAELEAEAEPSARKEERTE